MALGWWIYDLSDEEKTTRRAQLDRHAVYAQFSILAVLAILFIGSHVAQVINRYSVSNTKRTNLGSLIWFQKVRATWANAQWWLGGSLVRGWGTRGEWIGGALWTIWTMNLCLRNTGHDYFHPTKRFGIVAAGQLPFHYLLAMKSSYSPIQFLTRLSHEQLKGVHAVLGRILNIFFALHAVWYLNAFIQMGILQQRLKAPVVIYGIVAISLFGILSSVTLGFIRRWSYRLFYFTHISLSVVILAILYLHVHHIRVYVYETLAVVVVSNALRAYNMRTHTGHISIIPGTDLIKVSIPLSNAKEKGWRPGQHVFLSRPKAATSSEGIVSAFIRLNQINPFTVASIPSKDRELVLVARTLKGNTKKMATLAKALASSSARGEPIQDLSLTVEGPYGYPAYLPSFASYAHVLIVAGGVGATFAVPIFRSLTEFAPTGRRRPKVQLVWSVRSLAETRWAFLSKRGVSDDDNQHEDPEDTFRPSSIDIYVTRGSNAASARRVEEHSPSEHSPDDIELAEVDHLLSGDEDESIEKVRRDVAVHEGRPRLPVILDECFSEYSREDKVAVLMCGPAPLEESTRAAVGKWIHQGLDVYYHAEAFGW